MPRIPDFFIVGAQKSGTTALSEYLRQHPQVYMPREKDTQFFCDDFPRMRTIDNLEDFLALFQRARDEHLAVGEATALNLYSTVAIGRIRDFNPDARLIVLLRNPVDLVYSLHAQLVYTQEETETDFEKAWRRQGERAEGRHVPKGCRAPKQLQFKEVGKLGQQMERLFAVFPKEQVGVYLFDDLVADPRAVYEDVLAFLGVPSDGRTDFPRINPSKRPKIGLIARLTTRPPRSFERAVRWLKRLVGLDRFGILERVRAWNVEVSERPPLRQAFREELIETFREDIEKLQKLLDRDLSNWFKPEGGH